MRLPNRLSAILLAAFLVAAPAHAGTVVLSMTPSDVASVDLIQLSGGDFQFAQTTGGTRTYNIVNAAALASELKVTVPNPPADFAPFRLNINVPFTTSEVELFAALVDKFETTYSRRDVILTGPRKLRSRSIADLEMINQQSRLITQKILQRPSFNSEDVKIVLYFLVSSKELVLNSSVEPDSDMAQAAGLIRDALDNHPEYFSPDDTQTAEKALADFNQAGNVQLLQVSLLVDDQLRDGAADACDRADALEQRLASMDDAARQVADPNGLIGVKSLRNQMVCLAPKLTYPQDDTAMLKQNLGKAARLSGRVTCALEAFEQHPTASKTLVAAARRQQLAIDGMVKFDAELMGVDIPAPPDCGS